MKLTLIKFFPLYPFPVPGSNLGCRIVFSCLLVLDTFEYYLGILYNVLLPHPYGWTGVIWVFGKNTIGMIFPSNYIVSEATCYHHDSSLVKLNAFLVKVLSARPLDCKVNYFSLSTPCSLELGH